ncbi:hypothetical protein Cgig2_016835 [Carnegiea gigantea]|uniref:SOSEKI DIX-like domain-containing protein n=1 Tax=Carnegiea gigantea TaxID=171969 RepID=A0A9Q1QEL7_9CARY|nr:hypothetical protein Cgig2_016835 [Carnegiea gigantea]
MEARMNKYRQVSPDRAKVWRERSPKYVQNRKVPVVYYLCRNRQLEHPHFMEVPLSSREGLYLRDVIERLNVLRGRGMASMYSWSCKRSYKSGFVWHDLCEDDLILPAHGSEYILKGSEIIDESNPGARMGFFSRQHSCERWEHSALFLFVLAINKFHWINCPDRFSPVVAFRMHNLNQLPEPPSCRSQHDTSPSISTDGKEPTHSQEDDVSPPSQRSGSSASSPESRTGSHNSWGASLSLTDCKVSESEGATDASTQTEENVKKDGPKETCTRGVSTDDGILDGEPDENPETNAATAKLNSGTCSDSVSPPPSSSSATSSGGKAETLENLIRADAGKINSFRRSEEDDIRIPSNSRTKASSVLMQLISCGSISVKDHSFGLIPMHRPRFLDSKFPSPLYSTSVMLGELDCLSDSSIVMGHRMEDKEYFSGSLVETKMPKEEGHGHTLKRSSSYNADRSSKQLDSADNEEETSSAGSKCIPRSIKASLIRQPRGESMRSPHSDKPRVSSDGGHELRMISYDAADGGSKRMTEPCNGKKPTTREDSFRDEEKIIKIEES